MLEGLAVKIVNYKDIVISNKFRLESEFYTTKSVNYHDFYLGENILKFVQYGTSKALNEERSGYPVLRLNEFESAFISYPKKYCSLIANDDFDSLRLLKDDVLICRTNGNARYVGKSALVSTDTSYAYASYLFRIRPNKNMIRPSTLVMYLNCRYGRIEIERFSMHSNQVNFSPAKFKQIRIPKLNEKFNILIENIVYKAYRYHTESKNNYNQAEQQLLKELGLETFTPGNKAVNIKSLSESFGETGRLDAEYYQEKYDEYAKSIIGLSAKSKFIKDDFTLIKNKSTFNANFYNYIEIGDISVTDGTSACSLLSVSELPANAKINAQKGDVLVSKVRPNRGAVSIIDFNKENLIVSGALTVLRKKADALHTIQSLKVLLRTTIYRDWLLKFNVGTQYPVIHDDDIINLPLPVISNSSIQNISILVTKSKELKLRSNNLLNIAKKAVEIAIEKDEDAAINYINNEDKLLNPSKNNELLKDVSAS